jgi:hypothetical protein
MRLSITRKSKCSRNFTKFRICEVKKYPQRLPRKSIRYLRPSKISTCSFHPIFCERTSYHTNLTEIFLAKLQNFRFFSFDYYFSLYCKYFGKITIFLFSSIFVIFIYICIFDRNLRENAKTIIVCFKPTFLCLKQQL